jgi:hypothetical protein
MVDIGIPDSRIFRPFSSSSGKGGWMGEVWDEKPCLDPADTTCLVIRMAPASNRNEIPIRMNNLPYLGR